MPCTPGVSTAEGFTVPLVPQVWCVARVDRMLAAIIPRILAMSPAHRPNSLIALRVAVAALLAAHGWARQLSGGVAPFGEWLTSQGLPAGPAIAQGITWFEIGGTLLLAAGFRVPLLCVVFASIYATGIVLVHAPAGWFVVGLGRNGMEYSVLLLVCLGYLAYEHLPRSNRGPAAGQD